jgi:hypothetical protein
MIRITVPRAKAAAQRLFRIRPEIFEGSGFLTTRWYRGLMRIYNKVDHKKALKKGSKSLHTTRNSKIRIIPNT